MTQYIKQTESIIGNITPGGFHLWAEHFYKCKQDFKAPIGFSPVPYFLLCRAIELELKSRHLHKDPNIDVKVKFGHDLSKSYNALDDNQKILSNDEVNTLTSASEIYDGKEFEYFEAQNAGLGFSTFPNLSTLEVITTKLIAEGKKFFPWIS